MASIRKLKSGKYQVQIRRQGMPAVYRSFSKKKDAEAFVRRVEGDSELLLKLGKASGDIPLFSDWVTTHLQTYSGKDKDYPRKLQWWSEYFANIPVTKIDAFMVDDALNQLAKHGRNGKKPPATGKNGKSIKQRGAKGLTGSSLNRYKSALSACLTAFIRHKDFKRAGFTNPVIKESVNRYRENPAKDRFLSADEQSKLLEACKRASWEKLYLLVLMGLSTGARRGELLGLKWSDIDFNKRTASLPTTKNGKPRLLPLTRIVIQELMQFRENSDTLIFHNTQDKMTEYWFEKQWQKAKKAAGIDTLRFHDLRHTAASNLAHAGRSLFEIGTLLGHSSPQMTQRYSHLAVEHTISMVDDVMGALR